MRSAWTRSWRLAGVRRVKTATCDRIIEQMADRDIETQIGTYSLHQTSAFGEAKRGSDLEDALALYRNLLTLPMEDSMTESDQQRVVDELAVALRTTA